MISNAQGMFTVVPFLSPPGGTPGLFVFYEAFTESLLYLMNKIKIIFKTGRNFKNFML